MSLDYQLLMEFIEGLSEGGGNTWGRVERVCVENPWSTGTKVRTGAWDRGSQR